MSKKINENLMRNANAKQQKKLYNEIKKAGGDIGEKVAKSSKTKENKLSNVYYMNNPWDGARHIDTYESFQTQSKENTILEKSNLEDFYTWIGSDGDKGTGIELNDDSWVKGTKEDLKRPMFKNLPSNKDRKANNPLNYDFSKEKDEDKSKKVKKKTNIKK